MHSLTMPVKTTYVCFRTITTTATIMSTSAAACNPSDTAVELLSVADLIAWKVIEAPKKTVMHHRTVLRVTPAPYATAEYTRPFRAPALVGRPQTFHPEPRAPITAWRRPRTLDVAAPHLRSCVLASRRRHPGFPVERSWSTHEYGGGSSTLGGCDRATRRPDRGPLRRRPARDVRPRHLRRSPARCGGRTQLPPAPGRGEARR